MLTPQDSIFFSMVANLHDKEKLVLFVDLELSMFKVATEDFMKKVPTNTCALRDR